MKNENKILNLNLTFRSIKLGQGEKKYNRHMSLEKTANIEKRV
jgi:hypothetical protein